MVPKKEGYLLGMSREKYQNKYTGSFNKQHFHFLLKKNNAKYMELSTDPTQIFFLMTIITLNIINDYIPHEGLGRKKNKKEKKTTPLPQTQPQLRVHLGFSSLPVPKSQQTLIKFRSPYYISFLVKKKKIKFQKVLKVLVELHWKKRRAAMEDVYLFYCCIKDEE